jgi:hypothetical protein
MIDPTRVVNSVNADHIIAARSQRAHERFAEVTGRTGDENSHG